MLRLGVVVLSLGLAACGQVSRISECERFVGLANSTLKELAALDAPNQIVPEAKNYELLAARFDRFVADLEALKLADADLEKAVSPIRNAMKVAANDCREYARELHEHERLAGDGQASAQLNVRRKLKKTRARVAQSTRHYETLVKRVDAVCQPQ